MAGPSAPAPSAAAPSITVDKDLQLGTASNIFKGNKPLLWDDGGNGNNLALGKVALFNNSTGLRNTAVGYGALSYNRAGGDNVAVGQDALYDNEDASYNTAVGSGALANTYNAVENTAVGADALLNTYSLMINTEGRRNTAVGRSALKANTSGNFNVGVGGWALGNSETGDRNTAVGGLALRGYFGPPGSDNTALGYAAGDNVNGGSYNIHIGSYVLGASGDTYTTRIGDGQTQTFVAGIYTSPILFDHHPVYVNEEGKLGGGNVRKVTQSTVWKLTHPGRV